MDTPQDAGPSRSQIVDTLQGKAQIKQKIYDNTFEVFQTLKDVLHELSGEINEELEKVDKRIKLEYRDRGQYEAEIKVAGDVLVFSMHSNVFLFDRSHLIWKTSLVEKDGMSAYCGVINIYNFLSDSFKYNRLDDLGYLIGRLFVNKDNYYFVEGKRQLSASVHNYGKDAITRDSVVQVVQTAIQYALDFDLLVPPYDTVKIVSLGQLNNKIEDARVQTGKRLGFQFNADDVGHLHHHQ